jgi:hypothetical protein
MLRSTKRNIIIKAVKNRKLNLKTNPEMAELAVTAALALEAQAVAVIPATAVLL